MGCDDVLIMEVLGWIASNWENDEGRKNRWGRSVYFYSQSWCHLNHFFVQCLMKPRRSSRNQKDMKGDVEW